MVGRRSKRAAAAAALTKAQSNDDDDDDDDDEEDFAGDDDDEEDDYEFVPGQEDDGEDDDGNNKNNNDDNDSVAGILEGHLYYEDDTQILHYQGDSFHLCTVSLKDSSASSDNHMIWNPLRDPPPSGNLATYQMKGTIAPPGCTNNDDDDDEDDEETKLPMRIFDITWSIQHDGAPLLAGHHHLKTCPDKKSCESGEDEDDDDDNNENGSSNDNGKQKASPKRPALFYHVIGREVESATHENVLIQFQGGFYPPSSPSSSSSSSSSSGKKSASKTIKSVPLNCQFQYVLDEHTKPVAAAAAAAPPDDEDADADADEDFDWNELIALHKDAGMTVEDIKRRYQQSRVGKVSDDDDDGDGKPIAKKFKAAPKDDDDDDDDVGF